MMRRVRNLWIEGVLEESLYGGDVIDLGFAYRPAALGNSGVPSWQQAPEYDYLLPVGTKIQDVFSAAGGVLLVLGEPGAGKTTMLLELVNHLMQLAEADESRPVPVVFSLAPYSSDQTLADWLVDQLATNYEVPQKIGRRWIETQQYVPLLDGLDEVDPDHRAACAAAINDFRLQHSGVSLLVTARNRDYQALGSRLNMDKAIILQPLTPEQIDTYLARRGERLAGLRASLAADSTLRDLAQTPLMLSIMTLAYNRMPDEKTADVAPRQLTRNQLYEVYVERMARYRSKEMGYAPSNTIDWLSWLAKQMVREGKPTFFIEDMQPSWLPAGERDAFRRRTRWITFSILALPALPSLLWLLMSGRWGSALALALGGLLMAALPSLTGRFLVRARLPFGRIETVESLSWSWPWAALGFVIGAMAGLALGAFVSWIDRWSAVLWLALIPSAAAVLTMVENALLRGDLRLRTTPGQGIDQSGRNGRNVGLSVGAATLVLTVAITTLLAAVRDTSSLGDNLPWALWLTLYIGMGCSLAYGGLAWLQHRRLRHQLVNNRSIPEDLVPFLNFAAERNLLRRIGGGYTFSHALLLQYFSERNR